MAQEGETLAAPDVERSVFMVARFFLQRSFWLALMFCLVLAAKCETALAQPQSADEPWSMHLVAPMPPGLIGWWMGDGDAFDGVGHNNARAYGGVTYGAGIVGQAFHFDGQGGFVKAPTSDVNPGPGPGFTMEMWMRPDDLAKRRPLAGWSTTTKSGVSWWLEPALPGTPTRLGADLRDTKGGSHRLLSEPVVIVAGEWQHVALTYARNSGLLSLYFDGKVIGERNLGDIDAQTSLDFSVGKHAAVEAGATFKGGIDEVSVFSRALTLGEVRSIYEAGSVGKQLLSDDSNTFASEESWVPTTKRLASFAARDGGKSMSFASYIDGSDFVHIQGDKMWFVHGDWSLPGQHGGLNRPTRINGAQWFPQWNGNDSDKFALTSPFPAQDNPDFKIDVLKMGGDVAPRSQSAGITMVQKPAAANNYEAIIFLDDNQDGGPHWYIFSLGWAGP